MAMAVWCGGHVGGGTAFARGEGVLPRAPRRVEPHRRWLVTGGDGHHVGRAKKGGVRREEEKEEGEISDEEPVLAVRKKRRRFLSDLTGHALPPPPRVLVAGGKQQVGLRSQVVLVEAEKEEGEISPPPAMVAAAALPKTRQAHVGERAASAKKEAAAPVERKRRLPSALADHAQHPPPRVVVAAGREQQVGSHSQVVVVMVVEKEEEEISPPPAVVAAAHVGERVELKRRRLPAVRRAAQRTVAANSSPLKKAPPWRHHHQDTAEIEEGEIVEEGAVTTTDLGLGLGLGATGKEGKGMPVPAEVSLAATTTGARRGAASSFCVSEFIQEASTGVLPQCCRNVDDAYERLHKIGEGAYGVVFRARDKKTGETVALKKMKIENSGLPPTAVREIGILASLRQQPCIVGLREVVSSEDGVFVAMEYAEYDLHRVVKEMRRPFSQSEIKFLMKQLLQGIKSIHGRGVLHRDLKTSNLLVTRRGELKVCDFGLSRLCMGEIGEQRAYTDWVVTLWYRAPELLLRAKGYSAAIDIWSAGCIMAELAWKRPLFPGSNEVDQLHCIFDILGTPDEETWPGFAALCAELNAGFVMQPNSNRLREKLLATSLSEAGYDLLMSLLAYDPRKRLTAEQALNHKWFREFPTPTKLRF